MQTENRAAYGVEDACRMLGGIARSAYYELIANGELETFKIGRRRLVTPQAIAQFIERKQREGAEAAA